MYFSLNSRNISGNSITHNLKTLYGNICLEDNEDYIIDSVISSDCIGGIYKIQEFVTDNNGLIYILDSNANIWQYDYRRNQKDLIISQGNGVFTNEAKLSYSEGIIYIADLKSDNRITAYSINDNRILWAMEKIDDLPLFPLDITTDEKNNLYVLLPLGLTKTSGEGYKVRDGGKLGVVKISDSSDVVQIYENEDLKLQTGTKAEYLKNIASLEVTESGEVFVLNSQAEEIFNFHQDGKLRNHFKVEEPVFPSDLCIDSNNTIMVSDLQSVNYKAQYNSSIFKFDIKGSPSGRITGLTAGISRIALDKRNNIFALDKNGNAITIFELKKQTKESSIYKLPYGTLITFSLDSTAAETNWHKYILDAGIPEDTQLKISYFARENKEIIIDNKKADIDEFIRNDTISFEHKLAVLEKYWSKPQVNPKDSLIQGANGRYIWFKIEFSGSKGNTPSLNRIRIYYPRMSYLRYLPLVYQENPGSRDFLERYLSLFETFFSDIDEKINNISKYLDIDYVSGSFLRWIAGWVEVAVGEEWEDDKLRKFVKNAVDIYKRRGTIGSLAKIIEIYTGEKPIIIECYAIDKMAKKSEIKELVSRLYGMEHNSFCVLIRAQAIKSIKQQSEIEKVINNEKPAFTEAKLIILQPNIRLDAHSYLGLNSYLSDISLLHLNGTTAISNDTAIVD